MQFHLAQLQKLNRGVTPYGRAPHKPILLLALIEQFEKGELNYNWIEPTPELVAEFQDVWNLLVKTPHIPTFALPFFHLRGEKNELWSLVTYRDKTIPVTNSKSIKSYKALQESVAAAKLSDGFYQALLNPVARSEMKQLLLDTYFPHREANYLSQKRYSQVVEHEILYDATENYSRKVQVKFNELNKELVEQEIVVRGATFKKAIVNVYNKKCAISGLDVQFSSNTSMVDACHIIPFAESYDDTIRNGIALSPTFHRAFDRGLIAISDDYTTIIHKNVEDNSTYYGIKEFNNKPILLPQNPAYYPDLNKLEQHRKRFGF